MAHSTRPIPRTPRTSRAACSFCTAPMIRLSLTPRCWRLRKRCATPRSTGSLWPTAIPYIALPTGTCPRTIPGLRPTTRRPTGGPGRRCRISSRNASVKRPAISAPECAGPHSPGKRSEPGLQVSTLAMTTRNIAIRPVGAHERAAWEPLWKGYQTFYQARLSEEVTASTWTRLHDPAEPMFLLGAYVDGELAGIVHYLFHRSCWTVGDYCYLQDLFVAPAARNLGIGRALIEAVEKDARERGASRV